MSFGIGVENTNLWQNGPTPGSFYKFPNATQANNDPAKHTMSPTVTGTSVLGIKFNGGVLVAADTLGSYGSMARFRGCSRVLKVNDKTVMASGGDYADYQFLKALIEQRVIDEDCLNDGFNYSPKSLHCWLTRVLYNRRSKFNPLWNIILVGGMEGDEPFLGYVNLIGTAYKAPTLATGYGAYIAQPILREEYEKNPNMSLEEAKAVMERCMRVLFYRDARSWPEYEMAIVTKEGSKVEGPITVKSDWSVANFVKGYE